MDTSRRHFFARLVCIAFGAMNREILRNVDNQVKTQCRYAGEHNLTNCALLYCITTISK